MAVRITSREIGSIRGLSEPQGGERIRAALPAGVDFTPLLTLYLTESTTGEELKAARAGGLVGVKLYPAGATTHSDAGVRRVEAIYPQLEVMQAIDLPLLVHGEVTSAEVDLFDREAVFIDTQLIPLLALPQAGHPGAERRQAEAEPD